VPQRNKDYTSLGAKLISMASTSLSRTIAIPNRMTPSDARGITRDEIESDEDLEVLDISKSPEHLGGTVIEMRVSPNLLSWGEDLSVAITPTEVRIEGEKPQLLDWGTTKRSINRLGNRIEDRFHRDRL